MSIGHPIPEIRLFQNLTLKIQGQGHGWGGHWKSQHGSNIISSHILLIPCQSAIPFLRYDFFKIWLWISKVKIMGEGKNESHNMGPTIYRLTSLSFHVNRPSHSWDKTFSKFDFQKSKVKVMVDVKVWKSESGCSILSTHILFIPCQSAIPFLRYSIFKIWHWKSKVKVMGEVDIESHTMGWTFYRLTSFNSMSISHPIPEIWLFQNVTLKIQGQGHGWGECWKSQNGCNILSIHIPFVPC